MGDVVVYRNAAVDDFVDDELNRRDAQPIDMRRRELPVPNANPNRSRPAKRVVAIDVGATAVRAVEVETRDGTARVLKRGQAPIAPDAWRDLSAHRENIAEAIRVAMRLAGITVAGEIVAALPRRLATLKTVQLPPAPPEQIRGMVRFEAPQHIPFPLDEVELATEALDDPSDEMVTALLAAARRTIVSDLSAAFERAGAEVGRLSVTSLALARLLGAGALPIAAVRLDGPEIEVVVVSAGRLLYSRAASAPEGKVSEPWLLAQTERTLAAYAGEVPGQPASKVLLIGGQSDVTALETALSGKLTIPAERFDSRLLSASDPEAGAFAVATGLALDAPADRTRLNLLPETRADRRAAARNRLQQIAAVIVLFAALAGGVWWGYRAQQADRVERSRAERENLKLNMAQKVQKTKRVDHDRVVREYQTVSGGLSRALPVVDVLKAVSDAAPAGLVTLTQMTFERPATVTVQGTADKAASAMNLVIALQKSPSFASVRLGYVGDARADTLVKSKATKTAEGLKAAMAAKAAGGRVTFSITGTVRALPPVTAAALAAKPPATTLAKGGTAPRTGTARHHPATGARSSDDTAGLLPDILGTTNPTPASASPPANGSAPATTATPVSTPAPPAGVPSGATAVPTNPGEQPTPPPPGGNPQ